jgi:hypothetical protein
VVSSSFPIITLLSLLSPTKQLEPFGKHVLNLLNRQTFRFRHQQKDSNKADEGEGSIEKERGQGTQSLGQRQEGHAHN